MTQRCLVSTAIAILLLLCGSTAVAGGGPPETAWRAGLEVSAPAEATGIVLERASYEVDVIGATAVGTLVQEFLNDGELEVQAVYVGRLPRGTRPARLQLEIDGRVVEQAPAPREPARPQARRPGARGQRTPRVDAQLQRSESFSLLPGERLTVRAGFSVELSVHQGLFRLRLPTVVQTGAAATAAIPGGIRVTVFHDEPLPRVESATHEIWTSYEGDRTRVELAGGEAANNREFQLAFALGREDEPALLGYVGPERDGEREVMLVFAPTVEPRETSIRPKQLLFVLDTSGSMARGKLDKARLALASCLDKLGDADRFNIAEFDSSFTLMRPEPAAALGGARDQALAWLERQQAGGGTRLLPALESVLEQPESPDHHRMIVVLSDGIVSDETQVLELLSAKLGAGRLFVVGVGKDVRQDTILRLSEYGRGAAVFVDDPEQLETAMAGLFDSIASPLAWDLELDWGGADVELIGSHRIPDLYAARPVTVRARIRGELPSEVLLNVTTTEGVRTFATTLPQLTADRPELPPAAAHGPAKKIRPGR